jgi:hypothetical protein
MENELNSDSDRDIDMIRAEFEAWRSQRVGRPRIPKTLWDRAVSLLEHYPISTVSRELRLNAKRLSEAHNGNGKIVRRRNKRGRAAIVSGSPTLIPDFLQLSVNQRASIDRANHDAQEPASSIQQSVCSIVIERADGSRLTLRIPNQLLAIETLCSSFLRS